MKACKEVFNTKTYAKKRQTRKKIGWGGDRETAITTRNTTLYLEKLSLPFLSAKLYRMLRRIWNMQLKFKACNFLATALLQKKENNCILNFSIWVNGNNMQMSKSSVDVNLYELIIKNGITFGRKSEKYNIQLKGSLNVTYIVYFYEVRVKRNVMLCTCLFQLIRTVRLFCELNKKRYALLTTLRLMDNYYCCLLGIETKVIINNSMLLAMFPVHCSRTYSIPASA